MNTNPIEHNNFIIQMQGDGFRFMSNVSGTVASFWVVSANPVIRSIFAFSRSLTDGFESEEESDEKLWESAINIIKSKIDENRIQDLEEYTYEYRSGKFFPVNNVNWWNKTLRARLGM